MAAFFTLRVLGPVCAILIMHTHAQSCKNDHCLLQPASQKFPIDPIFHKFVILCICWDASSEKYWSLTITKSMLTLLITPGNEVMG